MDKDYGKIISQNLKRIAYENDRTQADICRDLKLSDSTVSSWFNGSRIPRMSKIDLLAHYFNCTRADIMEPHKAVQFNIGSNSFHDLLSVLQSIEPNLEYSDSSLEIIDLFVKFKRLSKDDQDEILNLIDYKLSRYKEKEKQDLA